MNIGKILGVGTGSALLGTAAALRKLSEKNFDYEFTNVDINNERNRAWLCDEPPNWDKFEKSKPVDMNKQYLCSDQDYYDNE